MAISLRVEDSLSAVENFGLWKERIVLFLEEFALWDIVKGTIIPPIDPI